MAARTEQPGADATPRATVVLYREAKQVIPTELTEALARQGSSPVVVDSAFAALAKLLQARPAVLLLCEPATLPAARDLLEAVERYCPRVTRWEFIATAEPPLRPVPIAIRTPSPAGAAAPNATKPNSAPNPPPVTRRTAPEIETFPLRLAEHPPSGPGSQDPPRTPRGASDVLTAEEMEALFSEDRR